MEHRNEIINESSSKEIFLQNSLVECEKPNIYSLETEFAKTKKNRDFQPYLIFFGFIFLLILGTVATVKYLEFKSTQVKIDIADFEDFRLKETLNAAMKQGKELDRKTEELDSKTKELNQMRSSFKKIQSELQNGDKRGTQKIDGKENSLVLKPYRNELDRNTFNALRSKINQLSNLMKKLLALPASNQVTPSLKQTNTLANSVINDYERLWSVLAEQLAQKNLELDGYQSGLSSFLKEKKATGCVIDPRLRGNIIVFIPKGQKITVGSLVVLYRSENEYIGQLKLTPAETGYKVEIVDLIKNQTIKPLDWFRLAK